jgi:hypothetical protein
MPSSDEPGSAHILAALDVARPLLEHVPEGAPRKPTACSNATAGPGGNL